MEKYLFLIRRYFLLPLILLVVSVGFSSVSFADDTSVLYSSEINLDSSFDFTLLDDRPLTLDLLAFDSTSDSILSSDVSSANPSDNLSKNYF